MAVRTNTNSNTGSVNTNTSGARSNPFVRGSQAPQGSQQEEVREEFKGAFFNLYLPRMEGEKKMQFMNYDSSKRQAVGVRLYENNPEHKYLIDGLKDGSLTTADVIASLVGTVSFVGYEDKPVVERKIGFAIKKVAVEPVAAAPVKGSEASE